jgi:oligoribonuclease NrnB/cAMP/cGMP phosphodiesterase (DHH superfamily)
MNEEVNEGNNPMNITGHKVLAIYHSADLDGKCSGAIIYRWCTRHKNEITLYGMNYGDDIPWAFIEWSDTVIISDFSLPMGDMEHIDAMCKNLLWYDHHKTAIADYKQSGLEIAGYRDTQLAGCELTWHGLFGGEPMPWVVSMLGAYDCWRWPTLSPEEQDDILNLQYGMRLDDWMPDSPDWVRLLQPGETPTRLMDAGHTVRKYQAQQMERINKTGRIFLWEGYTWFSINTHNCSSTDYEAKIAELQEHTPIDGVLVFYRDKTGWRYSLRSFSDCLDVSAVAKKYGGGGHKGAAGFSGGLLQGLV